MIAICVVYNIHEDGGPIYHFFKFRELRQYVGLH